MILGSPLSSGDGLPSTDFLISVDSLGDSCSHSDDA